MEAISREKDQYFQTPQRKIRSHLAKKVGTCEQSACSRVNKCKSCTASKCGSNRTVPAHLLTRRNLSSRWRVFPNEPFFTQLLFPPDGGNVCFQLVLSPPLLASYYSPLFPPGEGDFSPALLNSVEENGCIFLPVFL